MNETETVRALAARLPRWTIWYGQHTGSFWAVPRGADLRAAPHIEASNAMELEERAKQIEQRFHAPRPVKRPSTGPGRHARRRRRTAGAFS